MDGVNIGHLRERARHWRAKAMKERDPRKREDYLSRAASLDAAADMLREQAITRASERDAQAIQ